MFTKLLTRLKKCPGGYFFHCWHYRGYAPPRLDKKCKESRIEMCMYSCCNCSAKTMKESYDGR